MAVRVRDAWRAEHLPVVLFAILYAVGVVGHLWAVTLPLMLAITPLFLPLTGALALSNAFPRGERRLMGWIVLTFLVTYGLEVLGVHTGLVFGSYLYGSGLGPTVLGVPPLIGFNWVLVCLGALRLVQDLPLPRWGRPVLAAFLALGFDWVMEPVAIELGYWAWAGGDIPLQNYFAWFAIALGAGLAHEAWVRRRGGSVRTRLPVALFLSQLGFFSLLRVFFVP